MNYIDCHTHTRNSVDADKRATVFGYCEHAKKIKLSALAVTEHIEINKWAEYAETFEKSMAENTLEKERYPFLISGIEMGQATQNFETAELVMSDKRLDFVIASIHELPNKEDFAFLDYRDIDMKKILRENFLEILKLCRWGKFDVLGHLTYVLRYIYKQKLAVDISVYNEIIAESFKELISKGKGIEVNTSGLRQDYGKTFPNIKYIKLFKDLGGEVITIGSDAHKTNDVGNGVKETAEILLEAGFSYYTIFRERNPVQIRI
jgi:histidinol-phosphatase (PHP family)